ncbi:hypothetical protein [Bradyrhizobium australiense]|uniref:Uncharacterized protein n=1 Tax=Bradyrhizobium australiense TaxID=2721161 RepID=A0A7Y4LXS9_9BRAD|nr:hypothetical protein [Bradyrhizobium australiense]NOJ42030.1 hypothetical protein [Bradyrhizobium australiense]
MRWFRKDRPPEVWEADIHPEGDIEAAQRIREICVSVVAIAERMAGLHGRKAEAEKATEGERYQAAIKCALELAKQMADDAMRDVSVSQIIQLCVKANHLKTARVLLRAIQSEKIKDELIAESLVLIDQDAAN